MILKGFDFGNEAGDDATAEELASYFVEQPDFSQYTNKSKRLLITTARKGMGKSALIKRLYYVLKEKDPKALVIKCRGSDLSRDAFNLKTSLATPNDHIRDWMVRLCALLNREIAKTIDFALTDDQITLVESAEIDGYKEKNIVSCLSARFEKLLDKLGPKKRRG